MELPEPPWGRPQSLDEAVQIHSRWIARLAAGRPPLADSDQCGGCRYYVQLRGTLGMDWGACTNAESEYDRQCVFEHWTCLSFRR